MATQYKAKGKAGAFEELPITGGFVRLKRYHPTALNGVVAGTYKLLGSVGDGDWPLQHHEEDSDGQDADRLAESRLDLLVEKYSAPSRGFSRESEARLQMLERQLEAETPRYSDQETEEMLRRTQAVIADLLEG